MTRGWALAALGLLALLAAFLLTACAPAGPRGEVMLLDHAEIAPGAAEPTDAARWQPVALPDNWRLTRPHYDGFAWYRIRFELSALPHEPLAMYLPRLALMGEIWLNGSLLTPGVRFDSPEAKGVQMADAPIHIVLPSGLFRDGENEFRVRLQGSSAIRSGLSAFRIGPAEAVRAIWLPRQLLQVVAPYVAMVLVVGALCFVLAYTVRQRRVGAVAIALLAGIVTLASYLMTELPVSRGGQQAARLLVSVPMYWALCVAAYRLAGIHVRGFMTALHATSVLTMAAAVVMLGWGEVTDRIWLITWPHIALRWVVIGLVATRAWRDRSPKLMLLAASAALWNAAVMQSNFILMEWLGWDSFRWSVTGALPLCIILLFIFAERFVLDREEAARERRAAVVAERERILQDMHDGMGAQLITALRMARRPDVDRGDVARALEESLQDLRLIIDSLDAGENGLLALLGNLRFRLEPRLAAIGIALEWDVVPLPEASDLNPEAALAILRIVQEAINNVVQHAHASRMRITVRPAGNHVTIRIADDGRGIAAGAGRPGSRGLTGMRLRADKLGASLTVTSNDAGTEVMLQAPLSAG